MPVAEKMVKEGYDLFMTQEDSTQYDLKSVGKYRFYIYPVKVGREHLLAENESFKKNIPLWFLLRLEFYQER